MSLQPEQIRCSEDQYLALERNSEERHEYLDGQIYLMAGETLEHGAICVNLTAEISLQLKGTSCRAFSKGMKVRSGPLPRMPHSQKGLYSYPDLLIVCGEIQCLDENRDALINPKVIIDVLAPSAEAFNRSEKYQRCGAFEKFRRYRAFNPSMTDFMIVAQDRPLVEHFARRENEEWVIAASVTELSSSVYIDSVNCTLRLAEVYDRVEFPEKEEKPEDESG